MDQTDWRPPKSLTHPEAMKALLLAREIFSRFNNEDNQTANDETPQIVMDCSHGQEIPCGKFLARIEFNNKKDKILARKAFYKGYDWSWDEERQICVVHPKNTRIPQLNEVKMIQTKIMNNKTVHDNAKENGLCVYSSNGIAAIIFDKNIENDHVSDIEKWNEDKKWYTIKNLMYKKFNILSHIVPNYGFAIIVDGEYNEKKIKYFIKTKGDIIYSFAIKVIFEFDNEVKAIIEDLKCINFGFNAIKFKTKHLDEIENELNKIITNMPKVWSHLQNMNKNKIDALKISLHNEMKAINKKYCNYCGHKIKEKKKKLCAGCRSIYYCCLKCLKSEWNLHRQRCKNNRLTVNKYVSKSKVFMFDWK